MSERPIDTPPVGVDYNTERTPLVMPEYGRCVQEMVEHTLSLSDRAERQRCAQAIVAVMGSMTQQRGKASEVRQKLWNHLAAISQYQLDIDYPVEIERLDEKQQQRDIVPYPQQRIAKRHYGHIVETLAHRLGEIENPQERKLFTQQVANQMKRSLARWNRDAMNNEKVLDDLAEYMGTDTPFHAADLKLISDNTAVNDVQQPMHNKKKKKK